MRFRYIALFLVVFSCNLDKDPDPYQYRISSVRHVSQYLDYHFEYNQDTLVSISKVGGTSNHVYKTFQHREDTVFVTEFAADNRVIFNAQIIYAKGRVIQFRIENTRYGPGYDTLFFEYPNKKQLVVRRTDGYEMIAELDDRGNLVKIGNDRFDYDNNRNPLKDILFIDPILVYDYEESRFYTDTFILTRFISTDNLVRYTQHANPYTVFEYLYQYDKNSLPVSLTRKWLANGSFLEELKLYSYKYEQVN